MFKRLLAPLLVSATLAVGLVAAPVMPAPDAQAGDITNKSCVKGPETLRVIPPPSNLTEAQKRSWFEYTLTHDETCTWVDTTWYSGAASFTTRPEYTYIECVTGGVDNCRGKQREVPSLQGLDHLANLYNSAYNGGASVPGNAVAEKAVMAFGSENDRPCMLVNDRNIPTSQYLNIKIDRIDWAKGVNWRYKLIYNVTEVTRYVYDTRTKATTSSVTSKSQKYNDESTAYFDSCYYGAGVQPVETPCPVQIQDVYATGPTGAGIPAVNSINPTTGASTINPKTRSRTFKVADKGWLQDFGVNWNNGRYNSPRSSSENAGTFIAEVQGCGNSSLPRQNTLPSMGNYVYDIKTDYVWCSYTLFPGFSNGRAFDGCQKSIAYTTSEAETWSAHCQGVLEPRPSQLNMDPSSCVVPTCSWSSADSAGGKVLISGQYLNPDSRTATGKQVDPDRLQVTARGATFEITSPLASMEPRSMGGVTPQRVSGTKGTLWEVARGSTPWRPGAGVNASNQYFKSSWINKATPGAPVLVEVPADAAYNSWFGQQYFNLGWDGIKMNLYQASAPDNTATKQAGLLPAFYMRGIFLEQWKNGDMLGQTTAVRLTNGQADMVAGGPVNSGEPVDHLYYCTTTGKGSLKESASAMDRSWFSLRMLTGRTTG